MTGPAGWTTLIDVRPHEFPDLQLPRVALGIDLRIEELGRLNRAALAAEVETASDVAEWTPELRQAALLRAIEHGTDCHGWTLRLHERGVRLLHGEHSLVLGLPRSLIRYLAGDQANIPGTSSRGTGDQVAMAPPTTTVSEIPRYLHLVQEFEIEVTDPVAARTFIHAQLPDLSEHVEPDTEITEDDIALAVGFVVAEAFRTNGTEVGFHPMNSLTYPRDRDQGGDYSTQVLPPRPARPDPLVNDETPIPPD